MSSNNFTAVRGQSALLYHRTSMARQAMLVSEVDDPLFMFTYALLLWADTRPQLRPDLMLAVDRRLLCILHTLTSALDERAWPRGCIMRVRLAHEYSGVMLRVYGPYLAAL